MSKTLKAAVVQAGPVLFDTPKTMVKLASLARDAADKGADLVVFPEAFVGGYPKGIDFGAQLGMRSPDGREDFRRYHGSAIDPLGPEATRLGEIARDNGVERGRQLRRPVWEESHVDSCNNCNSGVMGRGSWWR